MSELELLEEHQDKGLMCFSEMQNEPCTITFTKGVGKFLINITNEYGKVYSRTIQKGRVSKFLKLFTTHWERNLEDNTKLLKFTEKGLERKAMIEKKSEEDTDVSLKKEVAVVTNIDMYELMRVKLFNSINDVESGKLTIEKANTMCNLAQTIVNIGGLELKKQG